MLNDKVPYQSMDARKLHNKMLIFVPSVSNVFLYILETISGPNGLNENSNMSFHSKKIF